MTEEKPHNPTGPRHLIEHLGPLLLRAIGAPKSIEEGNIDNLTGWRHAMHGIRTGVKRVLDNLLHREDEEDETHTHNH